MPALVALSVLLAAMLVLGGCAKLFVDVNDRDPAAGSIALSRGDSVAVHHIQADAGSEANGWNSHDAGQLQMDIVRQLQAHGIKATASDDNNGSSLAVTVSRFDKGSAVGRVFIFWGDTHLDGDAVLSTSAGMRKLEVIKSGQQKGVLAASDQTNVDIGYFAAALASKITR